MRVFISTLIICFSIAIGQAKSNSLICTNDLPCDAVDLGQISYGQFIGDPTIGIYDNTCATNLDEPNPFDNRGVSNDAAVWFTVTTDNNPGFLYIEATNDPEGTGDEIDLELAIYEQTSLCSGELRFVQSKFDNDRADIDMILACPKRNTTYYIFVDGLSRDPALRRGVFGLQVSQPLVEKGADFICDAPNLGQVPEGGTIGTQGPWSNYCATSVRDPQRANNAGFVIQTGVWFEFQAPASGHVIVDVTPDFTIQGLGPQFAVFGTSSGNCTGSYVEFGSLDNKNFENRSLEVSCLQPFGSYWVLVDGFGVGVGIFSVDIRDAGDIIPRTVIDTSICAGETFEVGAASYNISGSYEEVINLYEGCDSIVYTNLTVLEPVEVDFTIEQPGIGIGITNGIVQATVTGGDGNYSYEWSNGELEAVATTLVGRENYCVTVTDGLGCQGEVCFEMDLETVISPSFAVQNLNCFGDQNGGITFSVTGGVAPYDFSWRKLDANAQSVGSISADFEEQILDQLSGGSYEIRVEDGFGDTTIILNIQEPSPLQVLETTTMDASCHSTCDGQLAMNIVGGTGRYSVFWEDEMPSSAIRSNLCAGRYEAVIMDENGCKTREVIRIEEPEALIVDPEVVKEVSCFGGSDGELNVIFSGNPTNYRWNNNAITPSITGLTGGIYEVTVTNDDGCEASSQIFLPSPTAPVSVDLIIEKPISCAGENDGRLKASVSGPGINFNYEWSHGSSERIPSDLSPGNYSVTVSNELGCTAESALEIIEPVPLEVQYEVQSITCLEDQDYGSMEITSVTGGTPSIQFALNDGPFQERILYPQLEAGEYNLMARDAAGCRQSFQFFVDAPPELEVDLGKDQTIQLGDTFSINAISTVDGLDYEWYENDTLLNTYEPLLPRVQLLKNTKFKVKVFDPVTFCESEDEVYYQIRKDRRVFIPTAFSPNGDGKNETLQIFGGPDVKEIQTFRIFDRNGAMIYEANGFLPNTRDGEWDGTFKGQILSSGPFVYLAVIDFIDGGREVFRGEFTLLR